MEHRAYVRWVCKGDKNAATWTTNAHKDKINSSSMNRKSSDLSGKRETRTDMHVHIDESRECGHTLAIAWSIAVQVVVVLIEFYFISMPNSVNCISQRIQY